MTRIARIVKSNSHVDYVGRVIDPLDAAEPPAAEDYGFAQFVRLPLAGGGAEAEVVGVVYDTQLVNPEYGSLGPRLSPREEMAVLSPDYLNEQGVLVGILLVGWREAGRSGARASAARYGVPRRVIPVGQDVHAMTPDEVREFHTGAGGALALPYFSQVLAHAGAFAVPLVEAVIAQLEPGSTAEERQRLCVLKRTLAWQRTLGQVRL